MITNVFTHMPVCVFWVLSAFRAKLSMLLNAAWKQTALNDAGPVCGILVYKSCRAEMQYY
jgi:hypothetical protein